jgi:Salmonella virulence plasmid 65kDa B protein
MFEIVFDYGDHDPPAPMPGDDELEAPLGNRRYPWPLRPDAFSSYRAGFEVRTTRLCRRVLMFHHFPGEAGVGRDCLVRSTDLTHSGDLDPTDARLLHQQHDAEQDERGDRALRDQGDRHRDQPGHRGAHDRDERAQEDDDRERQRQRHPQDGGADADTRRVHQRDRERGADVADRVRQAR